MMMMSLIYLNNCNNKQNRSQTIDINYHHLRKKIEKEIYLKKKRPTEKVNKKN